MLNKFDQFNKFTRRYSILLCTLSLIFTLILSNQPSNALTVKDVPNPRQQNGGWVTDMVDMLSPQAETQLNQIISKLEKQNGTEIAVVTVPETKPSPTPKEFTTELFNSWGIGKKGKDNGILFLVSKGDRRTEIETGYGIEGILPDAKVGNIIRNQVTPQFKKGNFEAGIIAGTKALIQELGTDALEVNNSNINSPKPNKVPEQSRNTNPFIYVLLVLIGLPVWRFIVLPLTRFVFKIFAPSSPSTPKEYLSPSGTTSRYHITGKVYCKQCSKQMQQVEDTELESYLTQPQKVAKQIGNAKFQGWHCAYCATKTQLPQVHILIYELSKQLRCPTCKESTLKNSSEVIKGATQTTSGIRRKKSVCQCCDYINSTEEVIPMLSTFKTFSNSRNSYTSKPSSSSRSSSRSSSSSSSWDSYSSNDYSSYSSSDDSSSSSDDFGGGDSGGGGGGDDW